MRISLPPGTKIAGNRSEYEVVSFISVSDRAITVLCKNTNGKQYRLKVFDGECSVDGELLEKIPSVAKKSIVKIVDTGSFQNRPFLVSEDHPYQNLESQTVSVQTLISVVISQMLSVMQVFHTERIVLRDISPEHILYDQDGSSIYYSGFSNFLWLGKKAVYLRERGYGQRGEYIAPEVEKRGYSTASDYFSFGVTLLSILKGNKFSEGLTQELLYKELKAGSVPGIDVSYLRETSYEMYSTEDKLCYLILGLLIPNPDNRWGYGEVKCFLNDQHIPLIRKNGRIEYQYCTPFIINDIKCWNDKMIAQNLAKYADKISDSDFDELTEFLKKQAGNSFDKEVIPKNNSHKARIFKLAYYLDPSLDGLNWNGRCYESTDSFAEKVIKDPSLFEELKEILKNNCFSYYSLCRKKVGMTVSADIPEIEKLEALEKASPGTGANRCLMLFSKSADNRTFRIQGKDYTGIEELVSDDPVSVRRLKQQSFDIINNESFKAWLWARGLENAANEAVSKTKKNQSDAFTVLLTIFEVCTDNEEDKKKIRKIFLKYGDLSPVVWLIHNVKYYKTISPLNKDLHDRFLNMHLDLNANIATLNDILSHMVSDYQLFVQKTVNNPFVIENEEIKDGYTGFYPMYESGYFCIRRNGGLEVCPAFLRSSGEKIERAEVEKWLDAAEKEERESLERMLSSSEFKVRPGIRYYVKEQRKKLIISVIVMIAAVAFMILCFPVIHFISVIPFLGAFLFFWSFLSSYHKEKVRFNIANGEYDLYKEQRNRIMSRRDFLPGRKKEILRGIINGTNNPCRVYCKTK